MASMELLMMGVNGHRCDVVRSSESEGIMMCFEETAGVVEVKNGLCIS